MHLANLVLDSKKTFIKDTWDDRSKKIIIVHQKQKMQLTNISGGNNESHIFKQSSEENKTSKNL